MAGETRQKPAIRGLIAKVLADKLKLENLWHNQQREVEILGIYQAQSAKQSDCRYVDFNLKTSLTEYGLTGLMCQRVPL